MTNYVCMYKYLFNTCLISQHPIFWQYKPSLNCLWSTSQNFELRKYFTAYHIVNMWNSVCLQYRQHFLKIFQGALHYKYFITMWYTFFSVHAQHVAFSEVKTMPLWNMENILTKKNKPTVVRNLRFKLF